MVGYLLSNDDDAEEKPDAKGQKSGPSASTSQVTSDFKPRASTGVRSSTPSSFSGTRRKTYGSYAAAASRGQATPKGSQDDSFDQMVNKSFPGGNGKSLLGMPAGNFYGNQAAGPSTRSQAQGAVEKCPVCGSFQVSYVHVMTCESEKHQCVICDEVFPTQELQMSHFEGCFNEKKKETQRQKEQENGEQ